MRSKQKKKMRKSTKYIILIVSAILLALFAYRLMLNTSKSSEINTKKEIYSYTNKFNYDYNVSLLENGYMSRDSLGMDYKAFVTDLIDVISLNMNYEYKGSQATKIDYEYKVTGKLEGVYTRDGEEQKIWEENETILDKVTKSETKDNVKITQPLVLDLKEKNALVRNFEQELGMSITARYLVTLEVKFDTIVEGEKVTNTDKKTVAIELARKTTKIDGKNDDENTEYVSKEVKVSIGNNTLSICIDIAVIVTALFMIRYASKTKGANRIKNEYREEINRILRLCQDKIVKLDNRPNETDKEVVKVKDFGEIVKLSEELFKPILYWEDKEQEESWFIVMSNSVLYHYIIKRGE